MEPSGLHIWPRRTHMLMGLADKQGTMTGTLYVDNDAWPTDVDAAKLFLETHYGSAVPLLGGAEKAAKEMLEKPPGRLGTVWTEKYNLGGRVLLIGDAAHAIVPFFGQGCNCGFEDCVVLNELIETLLPAGRQLLTADWERVFEEFHNLRKPSADAIANMALENFVEMRDLVADKDFLKAKHVEKVLEDAFPLKFRSRYSMVCYGSALDGNMSYANVYKIGGHIKEVIADVVRRVEERVGSEYDYGSPSDSQTQIVKEVGEPLLDQRIQPKIEELQMDLSTV